MKRRWVMLALGLPVYAAGLAFVATVIMVALAQQDWTTYSWPAFPGDVAELFFEAEWWGVIGVPTIVVVASQLVFLVPVVSRRPPRGGRPRSLTVSLVLVAAVAASLTLGLALAVLEAISQWFDAAWIDDIAVEVSLLILVLGSWCFWSVLLIVFTRQIWPDRLLGRLVGLLLAGTVLEILVVVPLDIMVRRRTDCYCWSGTYFALCISAVALLWMAGPGVVIALFAKRHRMWRETHCERCGYPRTPAGGPNCPECGLKWPQHARK